MKYIRFYLEYPSKKEKNRRPAKNRKHTGNVCAVFTDLGGFPDWYASTAGPQVECISAVYYHANSPVCGSSASMHYLRDLCVRISEAKAREIHPQLFDYLDHMSEE